MTDEKDSKPTSVDEIREGNRRTVTSPETGRTYLIRLFEGVDAFRMGALPNMTKPEIPKTEETKELDDAAREELFEKYDQDRFKYDKEELEWSERVVCLCCIEPKVTRIEGQADGGILHVFELGDDVGWLCDKMLEKYEGKVLTSQDSQQKS